MKNLFTSLLLIFSMASFSQDYWNYNINFEDTSQFFRIKIDTIANPKNSWQIGPPQKTKFTNAYSPINAIVTDTVVSYPNNDSSQFYIYHLAQGGFTYPHTVILSGKYRVDSDTLSDYGTIEFSPDNGITWVNLLTDTYYYNRNCYYWYSEKPVLSGYSGDWKQFYVELGGFGWNFNIQHDDTILYRFSFYSDPYSSYKDGLIFDDFHFEDWFSIMRENNKNEIITNFYPNPATKTISVNFENPKAQNHCIWVYDEIGKLIVTKKNLYSNNTIFNIETWNNGIYYFKLKNTETNKLSVEKIVKTE